MPPPLPAAPLGTAIYPALQNLKVVVELFLDLNCPFSKRMYKTLSEGGVFAAYEAGGKVQWVFHNVIQPWHPTGAIMHEAALAVRSVSGGHFLPFVNAVFDHIETFSDEATYHKTRAQITEELVGLASSVGVDKATLTAKLALKEGGGNCGTGATQLVKFATKHHRVRGVHVTPTVFVNGQEAVEVSSGWSSEQWRELIDKTLAASD